MSNETVGRFAPSPSGYMHLGNLLAMLLAWLDCRAAGGRMILRMEDLDPVRTRPEYARAIADDLRWLGLDWDEGWPDSAYCQSSRTGLYEDAFHALEAAGLIYPCWCSRASRLAAASAPHPGEPVHDPRCRCFYLTAAERAALTAQRPPAWKVRVPAQTVTVSDGHYGPYAQDLARDCGDFIVRRADGVFAYQLAVSVDDMAMGVTRVVRGRDLLSSAPRQAWLIRTLGGTPPCYAHLPLLTGGPEGKLSKRLGSQSTQAMRQTWSPRALVGYLAYTAGLLPAPEPISPAGLIPLFSWDKVPRDDILIEKQ